MLDIRKERNGSELVVYLKGELDTGTAPKLLKDLEGEYAGVKKLVFEASELTYISSAGLRAILTAMQSLDDEDAPGAIRNVTEAVGDILRATGFDKVLDFE
ncbi:MAG: STAS domain-containing protein [Butyrivibrio sp.]|nr:STAS domain-containing protein [Butyrivibrio sp.]